MSTRKFYFAYHRFVGIVFPLKWAEEGGLPIGGRPILIPNTRKEITDMEFEYGSLASLEAKYPYIELPEATE